MAFLKTDSGEYRQLPVPAILSVGRSSTNDIRPSASQSKSMSATHAQISLSYVPNTDNRVEAYIEDIGSRFGTFVGYSPLEIERISGKTKLLYGQYIRFGHSSSYFQYLDKIPSYVEILPPELVVTPTKQFHQELLNYSSAPSVDLPSSKANNYSSSSQLDTAVENQQSSIFFPMSMNGDGDRSFISSPKPAMKAHSSMSQQDASSPTQLRQQQQQQQQSLNNSFQRVKFFDNNYSNNDDNNNNNNNNNNSDYNAAGSGFSKSHHYDDDNSSSSSMQISVNYPTKGGQGLHQPISITIDPTSTSASRKDRRSRPVSTTNQHQPMMSSADSSLRYSTQSSRSKAVVSPIQEGRYEQYSSDESLGLNVIQSDEFDRTGGRKKGLGSTSYDYYGGSTRDAVEQVDDFEPYQTASNRNSINSNGYNDNNYNSNNFSNNNYQGNNNSNSASRGNKDRYRDIDTINSLMATNPPPGFDQSSKGNSSSRMPRKKPLSAFDSMEALQKLSSKSTSWKEVSRANSNNNNNSSSKSRSPVDPALNSSYYYDRLNKEVVGTGGGGTDKSGMSQQQLLSGHIDYRAKLGDNGMLMEAIQPSDTKLVRRSWPEELRCPSSDIISRFVDHILAQEQGTTQKEYQLYQSIFRGQQNNDKRFDKEEVDDEDLSTYPFLSNLRLNPVKCDLPSVIPDNVMSEAVAEALLDNDRSTTGAIGTAITKLNDLMRQCLLGTTMDPSLPQSSIDFDQVLLGVVTDIIKSSVQSLRSAQQSNLVKALEESPPGSIDAMTGEGASSKRMKSSSSSSRSRSNVGLLLQQSIDSLTRIISFLHGMYLHDEARAIKLQTNDTYEVVALSLSSILNKLDACNVSIWSIGQRADEVTMEHVVTRSGGFLKSSLSLELEELRKLKRDSELIPLVERIRQQESSILERKLFRLVREVYDTADGVVA